MDDPTMTRLSLDKPPLALVLVQIRFSSRFDPTSGIDAFRTSCEEMGYPSFGYGELFAAKAPDGGAETLLPRWDLLDAERRRNIVVTPEFILFQTTEYTKFEGFLSHWKPILTAACRSFELPSVERVGLRYVDLIQPGPDESVSDYLNPALAGFEPDPAIGFSKERHIAATVLRTDHGRMLLRVSPALTAFPPDLDQIQQLRGLVDPSPGSVYLDLDHSSTGATFQADPETLARVTSDLHEAHDRLFQWTVTERALVAWGRKETP